MPTCKECGYENKDGNKYCANCGVLLLIKLEKPVSEPETSSQTKMIAGIIAVIIAFLIIMAAIQWTGTRSFTGVSETAFTIVIDSDTDWLDAIGGIGGSRTESGSRPASFVIRSSIVSACIQKQTEWGYLAVRIVKNGQTVEQ